MTVSARRLQRRVASVERTAGARRLVGEKRGVGCWRSTERGRPRGERGTGKMETHRLAFRIATAVSLAFLPHRRTGSPARRGSERGEPDSVTYKSTSAACSFLDDCRQQIITYTARAVLVRQRPGTMPAAARIAPVAAPVRASARAGDLRPAQSRGCASPAPRDEPFRRRRRDVLLTGAAAMTALGAPPAGRAEVTTPKGYEPPAWDPSGWNVLTASEDTLGCRYEIEWPSGWCALSDLSSARAVGVDASFKDPRDEASTLAVFVSRVGDEVRSQRDRGSLDAVAAGRADSAPRQVNIGKRERRTSVGGGGEYVAT